jgi:hypothetical protein
MNDKESGATLSNATPRSAKKPEYVSLSGLLNFIW